MAKSKSRRRQQPRGATTTAPRRRPSPAPPPRRGARTGLTIGRPHWLWGLFGFQMLTVLLSWAVGAIGGLGLVAFLVIAAGGVTYLAAQATAGAPADVAAVRLIVVATIVVVPVLFDQRMVDSFNLPKATAVMVGDLALSVVLVWRLAGRHQSWRWSILLWPALALAGWTGLATAFGQEPLISLLGYPTSDDGFLVTTALVAFMILLTQLLRTEDVVLCLKALFFGAGSLTIFYGLLQLHDVVWGGHWDWVRWSGNFPFLGLTAWSTFGNPDHFASFLATLLPVGGVLALLGTFVERIMAGAIALGLAAELLQTGVRGAWIAAGVATALMALFGYRELAGRPRLRRRGFAALGAAILVLALVVGLSPQYRQRVTSAFNVTSVGSSGQRVEIWDTAVNIANHHPIAGIGPDVFQDVFPRYQSVRFVKQYNADQAVNGAHNAFLNYLATTGYLGLILFLLLVGIAIVTSVTLWRSYRQPDVGDSTGESSPGPVSITGALVASLATLLVALFFEPQNVGLSFSFWLTLALISVLAADAGVNRLRDLGPTHLPPVGAALTNDGRRTNPSSTRFGRGRVTRRARQDQLRANAYVAVAAVIAVVLAFLALRPYRADVEFAGAERTAQAVRPGSSGASSQIQEAYSQVAAKVDAAVALDGWNPTYLQERAQALAAGALREPLGSPQQQSAYSAAVLAYDGLVSIQARSPFVYENYGEFLLGLYRVDRSQRAAGLRGVQMLRTALQNDPLEPTFRKNLSSAELLVGRSG